MTTIASSGPIRHRPAGTGRTYSVLGWAITLLDEPGENGDRLMLYEGRTDAGNLVPPHTEQNHESFYVLEGEFELTLGDEVRRCGPGDFASVDPGVVHSVKNVGEGPGRVLFAVAPGAQHERFFEQLGEEIEPGGDPIPLEGPPDFERVQALGRASGIEFLPPPG